MRFSVPVLLFMLAVQLTAGTNAQNPAAGAFVQNVGQVRYTNGLAAQHVRAELQTGNVNAYLHPAGMHLVQYRQHSNHDGTLSYDMLRIDVGLVGANTNSRMVVEEYSRGYHTYIIPETGRKGARAQRYRVVRFVDVLPGIDVRYTSEASGVKVDYIVHPGANPTSIQLRYSGITSASVDAEGNLTCSTPMGTLRESAPVAWTEPVVSTARTAPTRVNRQTSVAVRPVISGDVIRFDVDEYDRQHTLVIDPKIEWATYYAGNHAMLAPIRTTTDPDGNVFLAGTTVTRDLPLFAGVFQQRLKARTDAFISKFTDRGLLLWNTYVGGTGADLLEDMCADTSGSVWVCGSLDSGNHPLMDTAGAINYNKLGSGPFGDLVGDTITGTAGWVMRVTADGGWGDSWIMDGSGVDRVTSIAFKNNYLAFCGSTLSIRVNEQNGGAWAKNPANNTQNFDMFIARCSLKPGSTDRWKGDWFVYYGGDNDDFGVCVAVDRFGTVAAGGQTESTNLPKTDASTLQGGADAFVVLFATSGGIPDRRWARYLGGSDPFDRVNDVAMDANGNPVFVGYTPSSNFPVANANLGTLPGTLAGFITKFNAQSGAIAFSTFFGGNSQDNILSVSLDNADRIWVGGQTGGSTDLAVTNDAVQKTPYVTAVYPGLTDGFLAQLSANGQQITYCTYYGAPPQPNLPDPPTGMPPPPVPPDVDFGADYVSSVHCDGNAYIAVASLVNGLRMPTTPDAYQDANSLRKDTVTAAAFLSYWNNCKDSVISIVVNGSPVICNNESRQLRGPAGFAQYKWSTGEKSQNITVADSGSYILTCTTSDGCRYHDTVFIASAPNPTVNAGPDQIGCAGSLFKLQAVPSGGTPAYTYNWKRVEAGPSYINDPTSDAPEVNPNTTSRYVVTVTDAMGCTASDTVLIETINVLGRVTPTSKTFQQLDACTASTIDSVWVVNLGTDPITIDSAYTSTTAFAVVTNVTGGITIPPNDSVSIVVRATPQTPGTTTATFTVVGSPCTWRYSGTLSIEKAQLIASLQPTSVDFGTVLTCIPVKPDTVINVRNSGTNSLTLQPGVVAAPFRFLFPTEPVIIPPNGTVQVQVEFDPQTNGIFSETGILSFTSGDCTDSFRVTLRGQRAQPDVSLSATSLNVGTIEGCEDSRDTSLTITNNGTSPLTIELPGSSEVIFTPPGPLTIGSGESVTVQVTIRPANTGAFSATGNVVAQPCDLTIPVTFTAQKSGITLSTPPSVDLGELSTCFGPSTTTKAFQITFSGGSDGTVTSVQTGPTITTTLAPGVVLSNGQQGTFTVTWMPTADGTLVDSIVFVTEPCSIRRSIRITGIRTSVSLCLLDNPVNLGAIAASVSGTIRVWNCGNDTIAPLLRSSANIQITGQRPPAGSPIFVGDTLFVDYTVSCNPVIEDTIAIQPSTLCTNTVYSRIYGTCAGAGPPRATVELDSVAVNVGETASLRLRLSESENLDANGLSQWEADITYNPMVVVGTGSTPDCFASGMYSPCSIRISGMRTTDTDILTNLTFTAILGTAEATDITISRFRWLADTLAPVTTRNGHIRIANICDEGGVRLLSPKGDVFSIHVYPTPASTVLTIDVRGIGTVPGSYGVYSQLGQLVASGPLTPDAQGNAMAAVNVSSLGSGTYVLSVDARGSVYRVPIIITR